MKIELMAIGRTTNRELAQLIEHYADRVGHYVPFKFTALPDVKNTRSQSEAQQKTAEGQLFLRAIEPSDWVVLLDEHGKELTSVEMSRYVQRKMQSVPKRLLFLIGGPYGFSDEVRRRANEALSLSKMTFPHELIRLIFIEQLYRAFTILHGEPYHHE